MTISKKVSEKISMKFSASQLERTIVALINNPLNKKFAGNVMSLFNLFSEDSFKNDYEKEVRVFLIKKISSTIIDKKLENKDSLLSFVDVDGKYAEDATEILNNLFKLDIDNVELQALDELISQQLKMSLIDKSANALGDMITAFKTDNYDSSEKFIENFSQSVDTLNRDLTRAQESIIDAKKDISLSDGNFVNALGNIITEERCPGNKIKTGIKAINDCFNGGYEKGRLYLALGLAKGWKSGFLLNSSLWATKYNTYQTKDPNKKPVIVYLTMENSISETIKRIWSYCFGNNSEISAYEPNVAARMLQEAGIFTPDRPDLPELKIWYRSNRSISTVDLRNMLDELDKEGKEPVFLVLDYIKRIRPAQPNKELRLELGSVADELAAMAKDLDIPILSAMQINRDGFRLFEESTTMEGQISAVEKLGASNVGESIDLIQNCDIAFILGRVMRENINEKGEIEYNDSEFVF